MARHYIREWRKHRGVTMEKLAERAGVNQVVISRIERGHQRYNQDVAEKIAMALGVAVGDLLTKDPESPDPITEALSHLSPAQTAQALAIIKLIKEGPK